MKYTTFALKEKVLEMYPEIQRQNLSVGLVFDQERDLYVVSLTRGNESLATHLDKKDADECMKGVKCVYLGVQVAEFLKNFEGRRAFSRTAA